MGLIFTPGAYLASGWNRLDAFVVIASLVGVIGGNAPAFRVLRVLRVLRPLRLISLFPGMRLAVTLLLKALPEVLDVLAIYLCFLDVFATLGVQVRRHGSRVSASDRVAGIQGLRAGRLRGHTIGHGCVHTHP